jgi:hypothetical protein
MGQVRGLRHAVAAELPSLRTPLKLADAELRLIRVRKADTSAAQLPSGAAFGVTLIGPGNLFLDLEPERGRKHCIWVIFSMEVNLRNV